MTKKAAIRDMAAFHAALRDNKKPNIAVRFAPVSEPLVASEKERVATFVFSDNSVDRYGDTIDARGWVLDSFLANPVALFGHDSASVGNVIGKARNVRVQGDRLVGEIEFMEASVNPSAEAVYQMVKGGYLNACSVGFQPLEWSLAKDKSRIGGVDFKKQELLEISIVPIPANANALVQARAAGIDVDRLALIAGAKLRKISQRGLYEVSYLAQLLSDLDFLGDMVGWEAEIEGDGSAIPQRLTDALKMLGQILVDMTVEEVSELVSDEDDNGTVPVLVDDPTIMSALNPAQRAVVALVRMARIAAASSLAFSFQKFKATDVLKLLVEAAPEILAHPAKLNYAGILRAGKVLSSANEAKLRDAHGSITKGCDIMKGILDDATSDDGTADDNQTDKAKRQRLAEALKLKAAV